FDDFARVTRSHTMLFATANTQAILDTARGLLAGAGPLIEQRGLTLVGIAVANLENDVPAQLSLPFDPHSLDALDAALDEVRERLIDLVWPGLEPAAAAANLRTAVHRARRVLGAPVIVSRAELLALPADGMWIDIDELVGAVAAARRSKDAGEYERALALWGGDLLPDDVYETWAIERRRELHDELLSALEETAGILEASGDID